MPNTTNFNWPTPADTDLVKDGAAAIRNLGNGVDTSLVDLKGGTTGQILSKASNADMDFAFITPNVGDLTEVQAGTGISVASGTGPIPIVTNTMATEIDAKGDLVVGTGADTFARLAVGTDGHTLVADSVETTGLKWVAPGGAGANWTLLNAGGTALTGSATTTISSISGKDKIMVIVDSAGTAGTLARVEVRINGITTGDKYYVFGGFHQADTTYQVSNIVNKLGGQGYTNGIPLAIITTGNSICEGGVTFTGCNSTGVIQFISTGGANAGGQTDQRNIYAQGYVDTSGSPVSSISVRSTNGDFDAGTVYVYASA